LQCSALLFTSRLWVQWEQAMLNRMLDRGVLNRGVARRATASSAST